MFEGKQGSTRRAATANAIERYFRGKGVLLPVAAVDSVSVLANVMPMRDTDLLAAMPLQRK